MTTSPPAPHEPIAGSPAPRRRDAVSPPRAGLRRFPLHWPDVGRLALASATFSVLGIAIGELITQPLRHTWLGRSDESLERWLADHRTPWMNSATFVGSELADTVVKIAVTVVVALAMLAVWRRWLEPLMVALALIVEASAFITITWVVGRPRPAVPRLEASAVGTSFPSGHTAAAAVYGGIVVVLFWHTRRRWLRVFSVAVVVLVTALAGFSRMYRGMHHLSDVVAGIALGLGAVLVTRAVMLRVAAREGLPPCATQEVEACS
jgi:membrane-associated phospholipid phosphatase